MQLRLRVSIPKFKRNLCVTYYVEKLLEILSIETNVCFFAGVLCLKGLVSFTFLCVLGAYYQLVWFQMKANRMRAFIRHQSDAPDGVVKHTTIKFHRLIVVLGHHHFMVWKLPVEH